MRRTERLLAVLAGLTLGPFIMYFAYLLLTGIPDRSELITVSTADILDVKYGHINRKGRAISRMCFVTREWGCVVVTEEAMEFKDLEQAVAHRHPYVIGFVQEGELFSDSSERYNMVYSVVANGRSIKSFDGRVMETRALSIAVFGLGLAALGLAIRALLNLLLMGSSSAGSMGKR
jgi:hypothetical protein